MKTLLKMFFVLATLFAATFLVARLTGFLTIEQIEAWLAAAQELSPLFVGIIVASLLFADLFIAVPTLTICILAGNFLGFSGGVLASLTGMMLAGTVGHGLSILYGNRFIHFIAKDRAQVDEAKASFSRHGFTMILLSRALPILPEVTACLSGITRMRFPRFLTAWSISSVPYSLIACYAGSVSSLENPFPAIAAAIGLSGLLWISWLWFHRRQRQVARLKT